MQDDSTSDAKAMGWAFRPGLSSRLLALTVMFVLIAEALIYLPSLANFKSAWISERVEMAQTAVLAMEAASDKMVSDELSRRLLNSSQIVAVAAASENGRELILSPAMAIDGPVKAEDLRTSSFISKVISAFAMLFDDETKFLRLIQEPRFNGEFIEVIIEATPLRAAMLEFSGRILTLSLFISGFVGALIYFALFFLAVRPIRRITRSIERFRDDPRDWTSRILPSPRRDEIGRAETALSDMEAAVKSAMRERERLAELGEAMAKINHDLRNSLTAASIVSDGLSMSEDPRVQRAAPRLERAIERAIKLAEDTLRYGRSDPPAPVLQMAQLHPVFEEAAHEALAAHEGIVWINNVDAGRDALIDLDHLHRLAVNMIRNAAQAIAADKSREGVGRISLSARQDETGLYIEFADDGPGIPARIQESLFRPFSASGTRTGSGLGLAIARELAGGMGGKLSLLRTSTEGTVFELELPVTDRQK